MKVSKKEKASVSAATKTPTTKSFMQRKDYQTHPKPSTQKRVIERLKSMPRAYHQTYKRAMRGRSRKDAIKACCLECCYWQRQEVKLCTCKACPLFPYRPYQDFTQNSDNQHFTEPQGDKAEQRVSNMGLRYKSDLKTKIRL